MHWLTHPWLPYAAMAIVLMATLVLFITLKLDQVRQQRSLADRCRNLEEQLAACRVLLDRPPSPADSSPSDSPAESAGLNPVRRHLALAQLREGQPVPQVAETLGLPLSEIDLLLKVHRTTAGQSL